MTPERVRPAMADYETRCKICGRTFESEAALRKHVREIGLVD
jgi:hypothetical protein